MFSWLFSPRIKFDDRVEKLVASANILAVSSFTKFLNAHEELKAVDSQEWDFFVTVAGISVSLMGLVDKVTDESEYDRLTKILSAKIKEWDNRGEYALSDLMTRMVKHREDMMSLPSDEFTKMWAVMLSSWCLVNLNLEVPKSQPSKLMIELGMLLIVSFHGWWDEK